MSADNWTICPKCKAKSVAAREKAQLKAGQAYGKVSSDKYLDLLNAANSPIEEKDTLREDYEIGVRNGVFEVSYGCGCSVCGFEFQYNHSEDAV